MARLMTWGQKEWLLVSGALLLLATALKLGRLPALSGDEIVLLLLLWGLFTSVKGLENTGLLDQIAWRAENSGNITIKITLLTFLLAALVTNDAALIIIVPLTMTTNLPGKDWLIILEALAANAGSALTPFGNPQNLFIYWHYGLRFMEFVAVMAPFSLVSLAALLIFGRLVSGREEKHRAMPAGAGSCACARAALSASALAMVILVILHLLPIASLIPALLIMVLTDATALKTDYALLATFAVFMALSGNLRDMLGMEIADPHFVFAISALSSQVVSNVPVAVSMARMTGDWQALAWGTNAGGYGTLIASMANLIAWRFYTRPVSDGAQRRRFTMRFLAAGAMMLALLGLTWMLRSSLMAMS